MNRTNGVFGADETRRADRFGLGRRELLAGFAATAAGAAAWSLPGVSALRAAAQRTESADELGPAELITPATRNKIDAGLRYLARKQLTSGAYQGTFGTQGYAAGTAVTGLAGLAFMCSGSVPGDGPYGRHIDGCVDYLLRNTDDKGYVAVAGGYDNMYGHGFATLFLSEAYGMTQKPEIRAKLEKAIGLIVRCQNDQGGWRYQPQKSDADLSITICQIMALRAARDAGIDVPDETREKCIDYVKKSQNQDGSFRYTLQGGHGSFPLTAAGVVSLYSAGIYDGDAIEKGLAWLDRQRPGSGVASGGSYYFYGQYYAVQAMWHAGGEHWNLWYPAIREELLKNAAADGSWSDSQVGPEFGTAMACIILQMPLNYVPVFAP